MALRAHGVPKDKGTRLIMQDNCAQGDQPDYVVEDMERASKVAVNYQGKAVYITTWPEMTKDDLHEEARARHQVTKRCSAGSERRRTISKKTASTTGTTI
jgi:hypothetical protein